MSLSPQLHLETLTVIPMTPLTASANYATKELTSTQMVTAKESSLLSASSINSISGEFTTLKIWPLVFISVLWEQDATSVRKATLLSTKKITIGSAPRV